MTLPTPSAAQAFLAAARRVAKPAPNGARVIFGLDATMSRQPTWDLAASVQAEMFKAVGSIGGLAVQLVYFRGIEPVQAGPFHSNPQALARHMTTIKCRAGQTQIGSVLRHVRREHEKHPVAALILVVDACEEEASEIVRLAGEIMPVRAFVFHEAPDVNFHFVPLFKQIAAVTGGAYLPFDLSSAGKLAGLLAAVGTFAAGGTKALENSNTEAARLLLGHLR